MQNKSITILSSRGRGISADLSLIRTHLNGEYNTDEIMFRSFSKNERTNNDIQNQGVMKLRRQFCERAQNMICVDASITGKISDMEGKRLLYASPYDYQFKNTLMIEKRKRRIQMLKKFTHIIAGSPFTERLLGEAYELDDTKVITRTALPLAWEVCQPDKQLERQKRLALYFPQILSRKVITVLVSGNPEQEEAFFEKMDMKEFMNGLGENWFLLTNSNAMMEKAYVLSSRYSDSFGYINHLLQLHELLYVSDVLVTNNGRMAASFAGRLCGERERKIYCPLLKSSFFEEYMKKYFRELCIADISSGMGDWLQEGAHAATQKQFRDEFFYESAGNPYEKTAEIFGMDRVML